MSKKPAVIEDSDNTKRVYMYINCARFLKTQQKLNEMAAEGWKLAKVTPVLLKLYRLTFVKAEPDETEYYVFRSVEDHILGSRGGGVSALSHGQLIKPYSKKVKFVNHELFISLINKDVPYGHIASFTVYKLKLARKQSLIHMLTWAVVAIASAGLKMFDSAPFTPLIIGTLVLMGAFVVLNLIRLLSQQAKINYYQKLV